MMTDQERQRTHREPFTMFPNRYTDKVKPRLTSAQKAICDVVIRYTRGYHRDSAEISNAVFVRRTGLSERTVIRAKQNLKAMGLLVVLDEGGGNTTTRYMLDLYYDAPERSVRAAMHTTMHTTIPNIDTGMKVEASADDVGLHTDQYVQSTMVCETEDTTDNSTNPSAITEEARLHSEEHIPNIATLPDTPTLDSSREDTHTDAPVPAADVPQCSGDAGNYEDEVAGAGASGRGTSEGTAKMSPPQDPSIDLNIQKKQTMEDVPTGEPREAGKTASKEAIATVRFEFLSLFPDHTRQATLDEDYPYFGWAIKVFGVDTCLEKLRLLQEYRKVRVVENPKGLFRTALVKDYQPGKFVREKLRGDERARRAVERSRKHSDEWRAHTSNYDYEAAQQALQKLMETLN